MGIYYFLFIYDITYDKESSAAMDIESLKILDCLVRISSFLNGITADNVKMGIREKIFMTVVKLKQNSSYAFLAILFDCYTARHYSRVVKSTIALLSSCLRKAVAVKRRNFT